MRFVWLFVAAAATLTACDSSGTDPAPPVPSSPEPVLVPLAVGNFWVFSTTFTPYDRLTGEAGMERSYPVADTLRVVDSMEQGGETWFLLRASQTPGAGGLRAVYSGWFTNRPDGYYRLLDTDSTAFREVKYPVETGEVYAVVPPFLVADTTSYHFERQFVVKRTDYPVVVGDQLADGVLYTDTPLRLWVNGTDYGFLPSPPPLREVYAPGVGFAYLEIGFAGLVLPATASVQGIFRSTLLDVGIVVVD